MVATAPRLLSADANAPKSRRPHDGRRSNLTLVLQSLYDTPELTRAELARRTGLTKVTISDLVAELIDAELVRENGLAAGVRPGKPAATLMVRDDSTDVVALDLSTPDRVLGGVFTVRGERREELTLDLAGRTGDAAVAAVLELADRCRALATHPVLGIGVGTPGAVDVAGTIVAAPNLGWRDLALQPIMAERFALPAAVQNDANAGAMAERSFANGPDNLIRVQVARGVGAGILLGGKLVLGDSAAAGEIGHVVIDAGGMVCSCGKQGCLETWISTPALRRRLAADPPARDDILAEAGRRLGMALTPVVAALDVHDIVLGGQADLLGDPFRAACEEFIRDRVESSFGPDPVVRLSTLGDDAVLLGAVALVLRTTLGVS